MTRLILVKHSTPAIIESVPAREWRLSSAGRVRARQLADLLAPHRPARFVSSMESKARETAEILAATLRVICRVAVDLHEHDRRHSPYYSREQFQDLVRDFFANPEDLIFGEETARQAQMRFSTAVDRVLAEYPEEPTAIVAHGTVIALFVAQLTGMNGHTLWRELGLPAFVVLDFQSRSLLETVNLP